MSYKDKFARSSAALDSIQDDVADAVGETIDNVSGERIIREPGAPERTDFELTDAGYRRYLEECHDWAREQYREAVVNLEAATGAVKGGYPSIGRQGPGDREKREGEREAVQAVDDAQATVEHWLSVLETIEAAYKEA